VTSADRSRSQGTLKGCDTRANIILADSVEREYSTDEGVNMVALGLYMIKGDNMYAAGSSDAA
jgi:U6 snRNA-associated Sm-like protein LSm8